MTIFGEAIGRRLSPRRIVPVAVLGTALAVAACGGASSAQTSRKSAKASGKQLTIGFVSGDLTDSYYVTMQYGAQKEADKLGVKLDYQASAQFSASQQLTLVNAVLADKPNALVVDPDDATTLAPVVAKAKTSGIPVVTVDNRLTDKSNIVSEVFSDGFGGGQEAAKELAAEIGHKGTTYIMASNDTAPNDVLRMDGFRAALKKFPNIKNLGVQYTDAVISTGATQIEAIMQRFPTLNAVFCADSFSCAGAVEGLKSIGKINQVKVFGYDAEPTTMQAIEKGWQAGTVAQEPALEGALAVKYAVAAARKQSGIPKNVKTPSPLITFQALGKTKQWAYCTSVKNCHISTT